MRKHTRGCLATGASCGAVRGTTLINMLNPEVIVFAGELFEESDTFLPLVERVVKRRALKSYLPTVRLVRSRLNRRAGLQGVAMLALNKLLEKPLRFVG